MAGIIRALGGAFRRQLRFLLLLLLGYLAQQCIMPYAEVNGVTPNLLFALIGVITVAYGRLRALWAGAFFGLLLEAMMPQLKMVAMAVYPVSALFCSVLFADKAEKSLEYERSIGKTGRNRNPYVRTVLCAAANAAIFETVNILYIYLGGSTLLPSHFGRAVLCVLLTAVLALLVAWPARRFLGFRKRPMQEKDDQVRYDQ